MASRVVTYKEDVDNQIITVTTEDGQFIIYMDEDYCECPCGTSIELDGICPEGHESPLWSLF